MNHQKEKMELTPKKGWKEKYRIDRRENTNKLYT